MSRSGMALVSPFLSRIQSRAVFSSHSVTQTLTMTCCCCLASGPSSNNSGAGTGRYKKVETNAKFQTRMCCAPCAGGIYTWGWCLGQFIPITCGITQFLLRRKVLEGDMSKYRCCQGYFSCCCCTTSNCGESLCPCLCLCVEAHLCNCAAVSASRLFVMEKYNLSSDPCDVILIQCNNCMQCLACLCNVLAFILPCFKYCALAVDFLTTLMYMVVSGCMTAQVAHEMNYQVLYGNNKAIPEHMVQAGAVPVGKITPV